MKFYLEQPDNDETKSKMSENKTTAANPPALGYIFWNSVRLLSPPALPLIPFCFLLYIIPSNTPHSSLSFLSPCCLPLHALTLFLSSATVSLFVTPTFSLSLCPPSPSLPLLLRSPLFGELFISLCMSLISTCSKDMIGGLRRWRMGEGGESIDLSQRRTRRGWEVRKKGWERERKEGEETEARENVTMEIRRQEEGRGMEQGRRGKEGKGR